MYALAGEGFMNTRKANGGAAKITPMHFKTMAQIDVPQGRHGKHKEIITTILRDLDQLGAGAALKVPLSELAEGKAKVRSALNRATRKNGHTVATASDAAFLYIWNVPKKS
jgi:DNA helicase TIP49 (TBP-interacting protein)